MKVRLIVLLLVGSTLSGMQPEDRADIQSRHMKAFIGHKGFLSDAYHTLEKGWSELKEAVLGVSNTFYQHFLPHHPYRDFPCQVRFAPNDELCAAEIQTIQMRKYVALGSLERIMGRQIELEEIPTIAFCGSGGGFRAMILTLGFLQGLQDVDLLRTFTYMAGVSGSTWAIAPWVASGHELSVYYERMKNKIKDGIDHLDSKSELAKLVDRLIEKILYGQPMSAIDIYGALLANTLLFDLGENRIRATLTDTHCGVDMGGYPFPIYSTIATNTQPYEWLEVTPYEIGGSHLKSYIPTWGYGREFKNGISLNSPREQSLGYFMGIFGSAFQVDLEDLVRMTSDKLIAIEHQLPKVVAQSLEKVIHLFAYDLLDEIRLFPSVLSNFTYQLNKPSPWTGEDHLSLVDAGIDFNLPIPPLLRATRQVDCIVVYDSSASNKVGYELQKAQDYAWRKGLPFPLIDFTDIDKKIVSVFKDDSNPACPVVIYFPLIKNHEYSQTFDPRACMTSGYCSTFNFEYETDEAEELSGLSRFAVVQQQELLKEVIKEIIESKKVQN